MTNSIRVLLTGMVMSLLWLGAGAAGASAPAQAPPPAPVDISAAPPTQQLIIKFKPGADIGGLTRQQRDARMQTLSAQAGVQLSYFRPMSGGAHVLRLPAHRSLRIVQEIAAKLTRDAEVLYAEADAIMRPTLAPNDTRYNEQWHYQDVSGANYGANLPGAWDITTGDPNLVVAVIDTGDRSTHPDLAGRSVAGYDFISDVFAANDGDGRDNNPDDLGDWVAADDCGAGSNPSPSSWHGAHVGGTIGAASDNNDGVAGVNWTSKLIHGRALGRCGGFNSDIIDAMRWTAGLAVPGVPANPNPARVLNLSLGGPSACSNASQQAINEIVAANAVVVVAAGNENVDASGSSPANCNNVITVAATNISGNRAPYSNFGSVVEISAPGGDQTNANTEGVLSTVDTGTQGPVGAGYAFYEGTSMATPHVAGIVSLMLSVKPGLTPAQVLSILQSTVTPFPASSTCTTALCGAGIVNAAAAVAKAQTTDTTPSTKIYLPLVLKAGTGDTTPTSDFVNRVVIATNQNRTQNGCQPLANNALLNQAADRHTQDMALNDIFDHTGSDGSTPSQRIADTGYQASATGENIAAGDTTPEAVVESWMNSPGHRANILDCNFTEIGVGYYFLENDTGNSNYNHYWTQVFATPAN